eukprot:1158713-Pelagomonas_calceolata.AAC.9
MELGSKAQAEAVPVKHLEQHVSRATRDFMKLAEACCSKYLHGLRGVSGPAAQCWLGCSTQRMSGYGSACTRLALHQGQAPQEVTGCGDHLPE